MTTRGEDRLHLVVEDRGPGVEGMGGAGYLMKVVLPVLY